MRRVLTPHKEKYIKENYLKFSSREIGRILAVPRGTVTSFLKREGLKVPRTIGLQFKMKARLAQLDAIVHPEDELIKELCLLLPVKNLANLLGRSDSFVSGRIKKLNLKVPRKIVEEFIDYARIKKGHIPLNKGKKQTEYMSKESIERTKATRFHGNPHNTLFDGAITTRRDHPERNCKPHKYIRTAPGKWKELQIYNWEKENGPVPKGYVLACKDEDTLNCDPANWYLMTKADNAKRNSIHNYPQEIVDTIMLMGRMKRRINTTLKKLSNEK